MCVKYPASKLCQGCSLKSSVGERCSGGGAELRASGTKQDACGVLSLAGGLGGIEDGGCGHCALGKEDEVVGEPAGRLRGGHEVGDVLPEC